ncbi:MAG TPA: hypothetical protein VIZ86_16555 [Pseudomonas sp.]
MSSCNSSMTPQQQAQLAQAICATAEALGHDMSADAATLMAGDMACYPVLDVAEALRACRRELTGRLTIAAILQRLQKRDGHPEPDEAWAIALQAGDEAMTVVMTAEIQAALSIATPVLSAGDKIGGRRTFLVAYERILAQSRAADRPASWIVSYGHDQGHRLLALEEAGRLGRLTDADVARLAGPVRLALAPPTAAGGVIAGLLAGRVAEVDELPPEINRERWLELREEVARKAAENRERWAAERMAERADLERRKAAVAELIASEVRR